MTAELTSSSSSSPCEGKGVDPQSTAAATASSVSSSTEMHASSRFVQSRVGRTNQRYDGTTRLLACVVVLRTATRKRPAPPALHSTNATYSAEKDEQEVLVITSSKHPNEWIIPKGGWENDESVQECALREVEEEAGVSIPLLLMRLVALSYGILPWLTCDGPVLSCGAIRSPVCFRKSWGRLTF